LYDIYFIITRSFANEQEIDFYIAIIVTVLCQVQNLMFYSEEKCDVERII